MLVLLFVSISFIFKKRMLLKKDGIILLVCLTLLTSRRLDCRFNNWIFVILAKMLLNGARHVTE